MAATTVRPQEAPSDVSAIVRALQTRDFATAIELSKAGLAKQPQDLRLWTLQGMAAAGMRNPSAALGAYRRALQLSPGYLPALEGAAQTEFLLGRKGARNLLQQILKQRPEDPPTHALLGILDARARDCKAAVMHFDKARPVLSRQPEAEDDYGVCLGELGQDEPAIAVFQDILQRDPARRSVRYNLALAQWNARKPKDALETLKAALDRDSSDPDFLVLAAEISESDGDTVAAVAYLRRALVADPKRIDAYLRFATLSYDHASPKVGVDMLTFGIAQLPKEPRLYLVRGILLTQLGEFARAADDFETASHIDPRLQFLDVAQGLVRSQQHHSAEALEKFRAAVRAHPTEAYAHYLLAEALSEAGPAQGTPEYREEVRAVETAVRLDPRLTAAHDLLSSIYLESGKVEDSVAQSREALVVDPGDQQAVYHLIVALRKTSDKGEVPELLKRLMKLRAEPDAQQQHVKRYRLSDGEQSGSASAP